MTRVDAGPLTERDTSVLGPLAEHRILTVPQVALLLAVTNDTALRRLRALESKRLVQVRWLFRGLPAAATMNTRGLRAIGSALKPPVLNLNEYRHDVGVGWLWLAARAGDFGELRRITTDRRMQAEDAGALARGDAAPWGVGLGLLGGHGQAQRHYPDLMLDTASGHRFGVELELTAKSAGRMARIMTAYASDARVDAAFYLAANGSIAAGVREAARGAAIPERVHVRLLAPEGIAGAELGGVGQAMRSNSRVSAHGVREQPTAAAAAGATAGAAAER